MLLFLERASAAGELDPSKKVYCTFFKVMEMMSTVYDPLTGEPISTNVVGNSQSVSAQVDKPRETSGDARMSATGMYATVPVTPEVQQQMKKKARTTYQMKSKDVIVPRSLMGTSPKAYIQTLKGGLDVIDIHAGENEAYLYPLTKWIANPPRYDHSEIRKYKKLMNDTGIIACLSQRKSLYENEAKLKPKDKNGQRFKRHYLVRYKGGGEGSSSEEKKRVLQIIVNVSNRHC